MVIFEIIAFQNSIVKSNTANSKSFEIPTPLHSKRSLLASLIISAFAFIFVLFAISLLIASLFFLVKGSDEPFWLWVFILGLAILFNALWIFAGRKYKTTAYTNVKIDDSGIHYYNKLNGKTVKQYAWKDFEKTPGKNEYDVVKHTTYGYVNNARISADWVLWWFKEGDNIRSHQENFKGGHALYMIRNSKELIGRCLQMLTYHRPDLRIDPLLFSTFFIDKKTFTFERKVYIKTWAGAMVFIVIVLVLIDCWTNYRFGYTLFLDLLFFD